jgi:hypothetical protein
LRDLYFTAGLPFAASTVVYVLADIGAVPEADAYIGDILVAIGMACLVYCRCVAYSPTTQCDIYLNALRNVCPA